MEQVPEFLELSSEHKRTLLELLDYSVDNEGFVLEKNGRRKVCEFTNKYIHVDQAAIFPGSTFVINATPYAISQYLSYLQKESDVS